MRKYLILLAIGLFMGEMTQARTYRFAVFCDTRSNAGNSGQNGVNTATVYAVCRNLNEQGVKFVLAPGDFICGNVSWYQPAPPPSDQQYQTFLEAAASFNVGLPGSNHNIILYPVRGNHESYHDIMSEKEVKEAWFKNMGNMLPHNGPEDEIGFTYSFTFRNALFIGLDEYMHADSLEKNGICVNQAWIDSQIASHPDVQHVFAYGHAPAFPAKHRDCLGEFPEKANEFLRSVSRKSQVYFCGHDHFYARAKVPVYEKDSTIITGYMQQVITPTGAPFLSGTRDDNHKWNGVYTKNDGEINKDIQPETYIDNAVGYQLVTVSDDKITIQFIATTDACTFIRDATGVYQYTYNENWKTWKFAVMDEFSYQMEESELTMNGQN